TPFAVDAFSYGPVPGVQLYFLTHFHSDHYRGLSKRWQGGPIVCTPVTARLAHMCLGVDQRPTLPTTHHPPPVSPLQPHPPSYHTLVPTPSAISPRAFLSATILHTGDFRACDAMCTYRHLFPGAAVDRLYLDTTYCHPRYTYPHFTLFFPPFTHPLFTCATPPFAPPSHPPSALLCSRSFPDQQQVIDYAVAVAVAADKAERRAGGRVLFVVGAYSIGKERLFLAIAQALQESIFCLPRHHRLLHALQWPALSSRLTRDAASSPLHVLPLGQLRAHQHRMDKHATRLLRHLKRIVAQQESNHPSPVIGNEQRLNDAPATSTKDPLLSEAQRSALIPAPTAFPTLAAAIAAAASGTSSSRSKDPSQRAMMPPPSSRPSKSPRPSATNVSRRAAVAVASSSRSASLDARNAVAFPTLRGSDSSVKQQCNSRGVSSRESSDSAQDSCRNEEPNAWAMQNGEATPAGDAGERSGRRSTLQSGIASNAASDRAALKARPASKKRPRAAISLEIPGRNRVTSGSEPAVRQPPAVQLLQYLQSLLVARPKSQEQQKEQREQLAALNALTMDLLVENVVLAMTNSGGGGGGDASGTVAAATDEKLRGCGDGSNLPESPPPADAAWTHVDAPRANEAASGGNGFDKDDAWNAAVTDGANSLDSSSAACASASAAVAVILLAASAVSSSAVAQAPHSTVSPAASARLLSPSAPVPPLVSPLLPSANETPSAPPMFPRLESIAEAPTPVETSNERVMVVDQTADAASGNDPSATEGREVSLSEVPGVSWDELLKSMQDQSEDIIASSGCGISSDIPSLDDKVLVDKEAGEPELERSASGGGTESADMKQMQELLADLLQSPDLLEASAPAGSSGYGCDSAYGRSLDPWMQSLADSADEYMMDADGSEPSLKRLRLLPAYSALT
ncbi:unnamed protein product, partial [Closterium sp. NIES-64]